MNGKPLLLRVNLDANIADVVKSAVISYNLPENIKSKILKNWNKK